MIICANPLLDSCSEVFSVCTHACKVRDAESGTQLGLDLVMLTLENVRRDIPRYV